MAGVRVIAYCRVSTIGQARDGLGLPTQERMLRAWVRRQNHKLVAIVSENGKSGTLPDTERPGLLEVLSAIRTKKADAIVTTSLDRIARALTVQEAVLAKVWSMGGQVFTVDGEVVRDDPDDPMRTAMRQMAGVFHELDRKLVVKRLRNGRQTKAARGGHAVGAPPYGWRAQDAELVEDETEQATLEQIRMWKDDGLSLSAVARRLNDQGIQARRGRWHPTTVARVLSRS
jgi:DNA invertase Pin-like site-specific DNA recombinase